MKKLSILLFVFAACGSKPKKDPEKPVDTKKTDPVADPKPEDPKPVVEAPKPASDAWCATRPEQFGPFKIDATLAAQRRGTKAKTYADADSTKEKPVEVCGIPAGREWLAKTRCPDGSEGEQLGRVGSVGAGGRCGTIIDKYKVRCPDGTLDVFIDIYMCGPGEAM